MTTCRLLLVLVLGLPAAAHSEEAGSQASAPSEKPGDVEATDVAACAQRNVPEPDSLRAVRITRRDRDGNEQVSRLRMYGRRTPEGLREMVLRFAEPEDIKGAAFLFIERADGNDIYFTSPDLGRPKRIESKGRGAELFGTDLTYEDFEHMHGINRPGEWKRQADEVVRERPVYVIETRPADPEMSAYESVLSYVDKETCVALRIEFFESGGRLRKELIANPDWVQKRGPVWIAHQALMRDVREYTTTQVLVDSTDMNVSLRDDLFTPEGFALATP